MPKHMKYLVVVFAVFALIYSISRIPRPTLRPDTPAVPAEIEKVEISGEVLETPITFVHAGNRWALSVPLAYPADDVAVISLLAAVRSLTVEAVMSRREASWSLFGLDDAQGIRLSLWAPKAEKPLTWVIGKNSPDGLRVYARFPGQADVYLAKGLLREAFESAPDKWRESRILPLDPGEEIVSVRVRRGKEAFTLTRASDSWTLDGFPADRAAADKLVNTLQTATATEFVDPPASLNLKGFGLLTPQAEILVGLAGGRTCLLRIGKEEKEKPSRQILRRNEEPTLLWTPSQTLDLLKASPRDFKIKN